MSPVPKSKLYCAYAPCEIECGIGQCNLALGTQYKICSVHRNREAVQRAEEIQPLTKTSAADLMKASLPGGTSQTETVTEAKLAVLSSRHLASTSNP